MDNSVYGLFVFIVAVACASGAVIIAEKKGYKGAALAGWCFVGLFFNLLGIIIVLIIPTKVEGYVLQGKKKVCPFCKEAVQVDAILCKHCGSKLDAASTK